MCIRFGSVGGWDEGSKSKHSHDPDVLPHCSPLNPCDRDLISVIVVIRIDGGRLQNLGGGRAAPMPLPVSARGPASLQHFRNLPCQTDSSLKLPCIRPRTGASCIMHRLWLSGPDMEVRTTSYGIVILNQPPSAQTPSYSPPSSTLGQPNALCFPKPPEKTSLLH